VVDPLLCEDQESEPFDSEFHDAAGTDWLCQVPVSPGWGSHNNRAVQVALETAETDAFVFCTRTPFTDAIDTTFVAPPARYTTLAVAVAVERESAAASGC